MYQRLYIIANVYTFKLQMIRNKVLMIWHVLFRGVNSQLK